MKNPEVRLRVIFYLAFFLFVSHNLFMVKKDKAFKIIVILEVLALIFSSFGIWIAYTNCNIEVSHYEVKDDLIPTGFDGFRIAHVSDLHDKNWRGKLESLIAAEKPDMIVITGDIVDSSDRYYSNSLNFVKEAVKTAPVYFVSGNHEAYMTDYGFMKNALVEYGAKVLEDESVIIEKNGSYINLTGLSDPSFNDRSGSISFASVFEEKINSLTVEGLYNIVLSHRPEYFSSYAETDADLILCGHAHGGQVILPFVGGIYSPGQGIFPEYYQGMHTQNDSTMIVSRGLGDSYLPRINNMPELVMITLKSV